MREITQAAGAAPAALMRPQSSRVYKVFRPADWVSFRRDGRFAGSTDDQRDGFIHLSTWPQLTGTLERHFSREDDREVMVAAIEVARLGLGLRWEASRRGMEFPHFYAELLAEHVAGELRLVRSMQGGYALPSEEAT
jgi:uncharacterized protein (DUF952 family)